MTVALYTLQGRLNQWTSGTCPGPPDFFSFWGAPNWLWWNNFLKLIILLPSQRSTVRETWWILSSVRLGVPRASLQVKTLLTHWRHLRIRWNDPCAAAMLLFAGLLWTFVFPGAGEVWRDGGHGPRWRRQRQRSDVRLSQLGQQHCPRDLGRPVSDQLRPRAPAGRRLWGHRPRRRTQRPAHLRDRHQLQQLRRGAPDPGPIRYVGSVPIRIVGSVPNRADFGPTDDAGRSRGNWFRFRQCWVG